MIQIRERDVSTRKLEQLVTEAIRVTSPWNTKILVNDRLDVAMACGAAGCHLPAAGLPASEVKRVCPPGFIIGASTHTREEALFAEGGGADFLVFGPVYPTISKPGVLPVGVGTLAEIVELVRIPVFALGGITPERVSEIADTGAAGVAGISVFMNEESLPKLMTALQAAG